MATPSSKNGTGDLQFDWNDVRLFVLVAQSGSFRRAGTMSNRSVNSLRRRVRQLEHHMQCRLLVRGVQGSHLTERGRRLYEASLQMLDASYEVGREFHRSERDFTRNVSVSIAEGLGVHWILPKLAAFHAAHPNLTIELKCMGSPGRADFSLADISVHHGAPDRNDLKLVRLGHIHEQLFASRQAIAERGEPVTPDGLRQFTFVDLESDADDGDGDGDGDGNAKVVAFLPDRLVSVRTSSACAHYQAIANGSGIGLLPTYMAIFDEDLVSLFDEVHCRRDIYLTYRPDLREYREIRTVIDWLKSSFSSRQQPWFSDSFVPASEFRSRHEKGATSN